MSSRKTKYPDTDTFMYHNSNPKNRITSDCVVRALCTALNVSYHQVLTELVALQEETGYAFNDKKAYSKYLERKGWVKHPQPRKANNTKYTGKEFCHQVDKDVRYIVHMGSQHLTTIIGGKVIDIWDCTEGCVGNYWTKS